MKLMTNAVEKSLAAARARNEAAADGEATPVVVKFFTPDAQASWYIIEGRQIGSDWELFGLCDLGHGGAELGYVMLSDLQLIRGKLGLPVERDAWWSGTLADARKAVQS